MKQIIYLFHAVSRGNACSGTETNDEVRLSARCDGMENRLQDCGEGIVEMPCDCGSQAYLDCQQCKYNVKKHTPCIMTINFTIIQQTVLMER